MEELVAITDILTVTLGNSCRCHQQKQHHSGLFLTAEERKTFQQGTTTIEDTYF